MRPRLHQRQSSRRIWLNPGGGCSTNRHAGAGRAHALRLPPLRLRIERLAAIGAARVDVQRARAGRYGITRRIGQLGGRKRQRGMLARRAAAVEAGFDQHWVASTMDERRT